MSITHEQARKLIQLNMDQALNVQESASLSAHLRECSECSLYAHEIKEVVNVLSPILKRQWSIQPTPLSLAALTGKASGTKPNILLTMRTAAISLFFLALFFSAWQFVLSGSFGSNRAPMAILPVPTPSVLTVQSTSTELSLEGCTRNSYTVQEHDTLSSIAGQFSVSEELIMALNHVEAEGLRPGLELEIPVCDFTPTGTFRPATFTTTYTPVVNDSTSTPGG